MRAASSTASSALAEVSGTPDGVVVDGSEDPTAGLTVVPAADEQAHELPAERVSLAA
jgi:hypothetical protein